MTTGLAPKAWSPQASSPSRRSFATNAQVRLVCLARPRARGAARSHTFCRALAGTECRPAPLAQRQAPFPPDKGDMRGGARRQSLPRSGGLPLCDGSPLRAGGAGAARAQSGPRSAEAASVPHGRQPLGAELARALATVRRGERQRSPVRPDGCSGDSGHAGGRRRQSRQRRRKPPHDPGCGAVPDIRGGGRRGQRGGGGGAATPGCHRAAPAAIGAFPRAAADEAQRPVCCLRVREQRGGRWLSFDTCYPCPCLRRPRPTPRSALQPWTPTIFTFGTTRRALARTRRPGTLSAGTTPTQCTSCCGKPLSTPVQARGSLQSGPCSCADALLPDLPGTTRISQIAAS